VVRAIDLARRLKLPLSDAYAKVDLQDRGPQVGDPAEPLAGRDAYAREEREFAARPLPQRSTERESLAARAGRGVFGLFFSKLLFFALALFLAWQYVVPLFFK